MKPYFFYEIEKIVGGKIVSGDREMKFTEVGIDSRDVRFGQLFFAVEGERHDGHNFISDAVARGAKGAVVQKDLRPDFLTFHKDFGVLKVPSVVGALQSLSKDYRSSLKARVLGITGSVGKTGTKDFVRSVLAKKFSTYANPGNLNTHIGLPLALLDAPSTEYVVLEMGMRKRGEIKTLCEIAMPQMGIITDISASHVGVLGSVEEIADAKAELLEFLPENGLAILYGDNRYVREISSKARCETVFYGHHKACKYRLLDTVGLRDKGSRFFVEMEGQKEEFFIKPPGRHQVSNAVAAVSLGALLGLSPEEIREGLLEAKMSPMRAEIIKWRGITFINDAYNASPKSVKAALDLLADLWGKRKVAVLGDMLELGEYSVLSHEEVGAYAASKADHLICIGDLASYINKSWAEKKGPGQTGIWFPDKYGAAEYLFSFVKEGDVVLVKASRGLGLESMLEGNLSEEGCGC